MKLENTYKFLKIFAFVVLSFTSVFAAEEQSLFDDASSMMQFIEKSFANYSPSLPHEANIYAISDSTKKLEGDYKLAYNIIRKNEDIINIGIYWIKATNELYDLLTNQSPQYNASFLDQHALKSAGLTLYSTCNKSPEWRDSRDFFNYLFFDYPNTYVANFEYQSQENQEEIIKYFNSTRNITNAEAMMRNLFGFNEITIAEVKAMIDTEKARNNS